MRQIQSRIGPRSKRAAVRFVAALMTSTLFLMSSARATVVWTFNNTAFSDGTTVTGGFTVDSSDAPVASDLTIGDHAPFFPDVFNQGSTLTPPASYTFRGHFINFVGRQEVDLTFATPLPSTSGNVANFTLEEFLFDVDGNEISRTLHTDDLIGVASGVAVPEVSGSTMLGVLSVFCLAFSRWLRLSPARP